MVTQQDSIDAKSLLDFYYKIEDSIEWTEFGPKGSKGRQAGVQFMHGENPWSSAVGRSKGHHELLYDLMNPIFKESPIESLIKKYNLYKTRLMWVGPMSCYSMHCDRSPRIHVPLITNPDCYFLFNPGSLTHLSVGHVWHVDTRRKHTFINCSNDWRLHIVGCLED